MRYLERGQTDEERYQVFLDQEKKRGRLSALVRANLKTAWARITENEVGVPPEPGEIRFTNQEEE